VLNERDNTRDKMPMNMRPITDLFFMFLVLPEQLKGYILTVFHEANLFCDFGSLICFSYFYWTCFCRS
jgi:hypothetical protein